MAKKDKKKQTGGGIFKFIFIILISIFIVFSIMTITYKHNCEGLINNTTNLLRDLTKQDGIKDRGGICKALKDILGY